MTKATVPNVTISHTLDKVFTLKDTLSGCPGRKFSKLSCDRGELGSLHPQFSVDLEYLVCSGTVENACKHHVQNIAKSWRQSGEERSPALSPSSGITRGVFKLPFARNVEAVSTINLWIHYFWHI